MVYTIRTRMIVLFAISVLFFEPAKASGGNEKQNQLWTKISYPKNDGKNIIECPIPSALGRTLYSMNMLQWDLFNAHYVEGESPDTFMHALKEGSDKRPIFFVPCKLEDIDDPKLFYPYRRSLKNIALALSEKRHLNGVIEQAVLDEINSTQAYVQRKSDDLDRSYAQHKRLLAIWLSSGATTESVGIFTFFKCMSKPAKVGLFVLVSAFFYSAYKFLWNLFQYRKRKNQKKGMEKYVNDFNLGVAALKAKLKNP